MTALAQPRTSRPRPTFDALATQLALALPGDAAYDAAAPWDRAVESRPAAVVFAESGDDVAAAVTFARANDLRVAVRSTGHGAVAIGDDVLLIHTERMTDCTIDVTGGWARAGAGAQWQQVLDAACPAGFAPLCGSAPGVGVVGFLTGGGIGPFAHTYGISSDWVRAFDVVTGDGRQRRATTTENPDLFWGLRGGKATVGIVTAVEFDLPRLARFYGGAMWFAGNDAAAVSAAWRRLVNCLPDEGTTSIAFLNLPPLPHLPPSIAGRSTVAVRFAWTGNPQDGRRRLAELRRVAKVLIDDIDVRPYSELARVHSDPVGPMPVNSRSALLRDLPQSGVDALIGAVSDHNPHTIIELRALGGAIARGPQQPSAVCHRDAAFSLFMSAPARPEADAATAEHTEQVLAAMAPWTMPGLLPNFAASGNPKTIARYYDPETAQRLSRLADCYDPDHVLATGQVVRAAITHRKTGKEIS
jgi:FAD binding domain